MPKHDTKREEMMSKKKRFSSLSTIDSNRRAIIITPKAYAKMYAYVNATNSEISGFGKIREITPKEQFKEKYYLVEDVRIFPQTCTTGGTTLDSAELSKFIITLIKSKENPYDWRLWWHSHYDFNASWSSIDEDAIGQLINAGDQNSELISICINQQGRIVARRDTLFQKHERLTVAIQPLPNEIISKECAKEVKEKVKVEYYRNWKDDGEWERIIEKYQKRRTNTKLTPRLITFDKKVNKAQTLYWDPERKIFVDKNRKPLTIDEVNHGLHASVGNRRPITDSNVGY